MKLDINTTARVALVTCLLIATAAGAVWYFHSANRYMAYQIYTDDPVSGLIVEAPVEFHGVDVGKVRDIRLVSPHLVAIELSIDKAAPITSASVATITSRGLATRGFTGYVYISLDDIGTDTRPLATPPGAAYPIIRTAMSKVITLDTTINQVKDNTQAITDLLQTLLDEKTIASMQQSILSLQQVTKVLADNSNKLDSIVANTERASHHFEPLLRSSDDAMRTFRAQTLPDLHETLTSIAPLLESSRDTVRALQLQVLPEAHKALVSIDELSTTFNGLVTKLNRDPSILIRGTVPPPPGPGESK